MKDYRIEVAYTPQLLINLVNEAIKAGYTPIGGIAIRPGIKEVDRSLYVQAMLKDENK